MKNWSTEGRHNSSLRPRKFQELAISIQSHVDCFWDDKDVITLGFLEHNNNKPLFNLVKPRYL